MTRAVSPLETSLAADGRASLRQLVRGDLACVRNRDPAARTLIETLVTYPGVHAMIWHRLAHWLWARGLLIAHPETESRFIVELGAGAEAGIELSRDWHLVVTALLLVPQQRPSFFVDELGPIYGLPAYGGGRRPGIASVGPIPIV